MTHYSVEPRTKYEKKLLVTATKTGLDAAKNCSKKIVRKTAKATG